MTGAAGAIRRAGDPPAGDAAGDPHPRFDPDEYGRRHAEVDRLRERAGCDALVVFGTSQSQHDLRFLTAWPPRQEGWLVLVPGAEPALRVQLYNHVPTARAMAVVADVAWAGRSSAETVAALLASHGVRRVGLVGPVTWQAHGRLAASLPGTDLVDLTPAFRRMRLVKSEAEIAWTRRGAELCDTALAALVDGARPGMREDELGALVEHAYARLGGQHGICFLATAPMEGGGAIVPAQQWSSRRLRAGDAIIIELSAGIGGYTGQVLRTIAVGAEPPARYAALHAVAERAYAEISAAIRPGATAADLLAAAGSIEAAGHTICDDLVHGYGGGYLEPVLRTRGTMHGPVPDLVLEPGMMLVVQPNVVTADGRLGVQTGELRVVTPAGSESLHRAPAGLLRAG